MTRDRVATNASRNEPWSLLAELVGDMSYDDERRGAKLSITS